MVLPEKNPAAATRMAATCKEFIRVWVQVVFLIDEPPKENNSCKNYLPC
jgi:hypothetical protein